MLSLNNFQIENKTVLVRVDFNVSHKKGKILDSSKIRASIPTIKYLLSKNCRIILATHLGDPKGKFVSELKTDFLTKQLEELLPKEKIILFDDCIGKDLKEKIISSPKRTIFLLENLRFYKGEEDNDPVFAHLLANLAEVYVNDAFAVCHRKHASVCAITKYLPSLSGLLLDKEVYRLSQALHPQKPAIWIMGGAKLDKLDLIHQALKKAEHILIGGALSFSFLKAKRIEVGMSKVDFNSVKIAEKILKLYSKKIILPLDFKVTKEFSSNAPSRIASYNQIGKNEVALDSGPETINLFERYLSTANTIVWNGPLGYFEWAKYSLATKEIGRFLGKRKAIKIAGGGETVSAIRNFHLEHNFTHVSTGGGASLEFLSGKKLPGIEALKKSQIKLRRKAAIKRWFRI